jgi:hypothetical protein
MTPFEEFVEYLRKNEPDNYRDNSITRNKLLEYYETCTIKTYWYFLKLLKNAAISNISITPDVIKFDVSVNWAAEWADCVVDGPTISYQG